MASWYRPASAPALISSSTSCTTMSGSGTVGLPRESSWHARYSSGQFTPSTSNLRWSSCREIPPSPVKTLTTFCTVMTSPAFFLKRARPESLGPGAAAATAPAAAGAAVSPPCSAEPAASDRRGRSGYISLMFSGTDASKSHRVTPRSRRIWIASWMASPASPLLCSHTLPVGMSCAMDLTRIRLESPGNESSSAGVGYLAIAFFSLFSVDCTCPRYL
mmetsp:Transcript_24999/g.65188  ORF Transcript_24999/g.65188 Transcript_24999/m.65188 type:complete len:218 (+) Transcript_24999:896-1549(+)